MEQDRIRRIAEQLDFSREQVGSTVGMLREGATIPFIARYRKERTGSLDEQAIAAIQAELHRLEKLEQRKESVLAAIEEQGKLTGELARRIRSCFDLEVLEDLYLPYKRKRETKADKARKWGLGPLAALILEQRERDIRSRARGFLRAGIPDVDTAIGGALWIVAEHFNEQAALRESLREIFRQHARVQCKAGRKAGDSGDKYKDYLGYDQRAADVPSHRLLAILRAETEGVLSVRIRPDEERSLAQLSRMAYKHFAPSAELLAAALADCYGRLLCPSIETQYRAELKQRADREAIAVFSSNLRQLLLAAPLGPRVVLAMDPGYRTGCKVVCLDRQGGLLAHDTWFLHPPKADLARAGQQLAAWSERYGIEAVAVGDGTAGKETLAWAREIFHETKVAVYAVDESGASIYSASEVAREEFPDLDLTVRGAISIGRRLMDPMAELIKIDPKSIGVGQYQHDVDQKELMAALEQTLSSCVHAVGVRLNTASKYLLAQLGGIGPGLAESIVIYREKSGPFRRIEELLNVPRFGPKAFELAAGFLRIPEGDEPLDNTAVHPESYHIVRRMAADAGVSVSQLIRDPALRKSIDIGRYITPEAGRPTLQDIMDALDKPGLDPRGEAEVLEFTPGLRDITDVQVGMVLNGIVTNITKFGVFVDIGIKENGLIHVSQLADRFVSDPAEVVGLRQQLRVRVVDVDVDRARISLSRKGL